jgi:endonuclease/exonuclease/phosphatase family metal-dependent hydrolase
MAAQAAELAAFVPTDRPAIVMGDLNDGPGSAMHQVMTGQGFSDVWESAHPGAAGLTCCHSSNLANQTADFTQRIDYVFARDIGRLIGSGIDIIGNVPADHLAGPAHALWPSDHAGLIATLRR